MSLGMKHRYHASLGMPTMSQQYGGDTKVGSRNSVDELWWRLMPVFYGVGVRKKDDEG